MPDFRDSAALGELATRALDGTGYHFYLLKGQVRPDVVIVRDVTATLLASARTDAEKAEREYRRQYLPPPTRDQPRPGAAAVAAAQDLERLAKALGGALTLLNHQLVPENALLAARADKDPGFIERLTAADQLVVGHAAWIRSGVAARSAAELAAAAPEVLPALPELARAISQRQELLKVTHYSIAPRQ
jgi:hypothetical protein